MTASIDCPGLEMEPAIWTTTGILKPESETPSLKINKKTKERGLPLSAVLGREPEQRSAYSSV